MKKGHSIIVVMAVLKIAASDLQKNYFLCSFSLIGWWFYTLTLCLIAHIKMVLKSFILR